MARNKKMVSSIASVPIRVSTRNKVNVVLDDVLQPLARVISVRSVDVSYDIDDANRDEICNGVVRVGGCKRTFVTFQFINELALDGINVIHWPSVEEGLFSFFVCPYSKSLLHLYVTPVSFSNVKVMCIYRTIS